MGAALLIIDMQNGCREECRCKDAFDSAADYINEASKLFRERNAPVIIVQDIGVGGGPGSPGFDVVKSINRSSTDIVLHKDYNNAFWKTELENILRDKGIQFVVISGFAAEYCVVFTYNGAIERGFKASLLQKGITGDTEEGIRSIQLLRPVISLHALMYFLS